MCCYTVAWKNSREIARNITRPVLSVKEVFFPPTERLFTIQKTGQEIHLEETFPDWETVVFGVRPCDARGVRLLDAAFLDTDPVDSFYARRRENTTLIGLACKELAETCFCTSVGGTPDDGCDMDVMLYEMDEGYLVEAITEKGRFLIPDGDWKETGIAIPRPAISRRSSRSRKKGSGRSISTMPTGRRCPSAVFPAGPVPMSVRPAAVLPSGMK